MAASPVELWSTRLSCPQIHGRISSLPQQLPSATLGEPENPSLNSDPGCIKVVDTYRTAEIGSPPAVAGESGVDSLCESPPCLEREGEPCRQRRPHRFNFRLTMNAN